MDIKQKIAAWLIVSILFSCRKKNLECQKAGYEYTNTTSYCQYTPPKDSITLNDSIFLIASVPRTFIDETSNVTVHNIAAIIEGPVHVVMLYPTEQPSVDSFELIAQTGKVIKDTINFSEGILKGFRTIQWDGNSSDSLKVKITIKPKAKGVYAISLGQQGYKDSDCALYKYFLRIENEQHLYYLSQYNNGYIGDYERNFSYCFKVY